MKKTLFLLLIAAVTFPAYSQLRTPQPSPAGSVSTTVGLTDIKVDYFRPKMKGRKVFGSTPDAVVPYGKIWRTGANSGSKITFSEDVKVEGINVPKGEYLILTWPGATEWTVALNKNTKLGGATDKYDASQDIAKFKVKPEKLTEKVETFTINITDLAEDSKSAKIQLAWDQTSVKFGVTVDYDAQVMKSIEDNTRVNPYNYYQAAVYYLENGKDLNKALEWINLAAANNPSAYWILHQKAKIQKALGDKAGAKESATASLNAAKQANNSEYQAMNENLMKTLN